MNLRQLKSLKKRLDALSVISINATKEIESMYQRVAAEEEPEAIIADIEKLKKALNKATEEQAEISNKLLADK